MKCPDSNLVSEYDRAYCKPHYFDHKETVERPFIVSLTQKARLSAGASILDAGCGQGFFTWLFAQLGFRATGIDISNQAILSAQREYTSSGARFEVGDIGSLSYIEAFDCVFARGLSLYNSDDFEVAHHVTDVFLKYLKPGGVFIFVYYTVINPRKRSTTWRYHSVRNIKQHFAKYPSRQIFFSLRSGTGWLRSLAISKPVSLIDMTISYLTGMGGYAVVIVPKTR
jgi:SAM-dependent methyltransferase